MSDDLVVIVPSRGRPANVARLMEACQKTCRARTRLHFGFDIDDPHVRANLDAADWPDALATTGPRDGLTGWTNKIAMRHLGAYALASIGDDMVPETVGWDEKLLAALPDGCGLSYPDVKRGPEHGRRYADVPEAVVISAAIVAELGGMCPRENGTEIVKHWYVDNMWRDIGTGAGCFAYCPDVTVRHLHPNVTGEPGDATYYDAAQSYDRDSAAYRRWKLAKWGLTGCIDAVRRVRAEAAGQLRHRGPHADPVHVGEGLA